MRVALVGNLAGTGYSVLRFLKAKGIEAHLFIPKWEMGVSRAELEENQILSESAAWLHEYGWTYKPSANPIIRILQFIKSSLIYASEALKLGHFDMIQSFTGSLFSNTVWYLVFGFFRYRPYIACATGSDLREVALQNDLAGKRMRSFFQKASRTLLLNLDMVELKDKLELDNAEFFPFIIDTEKYSPKHVERDYVPPGRLLFFMPSHLDWGVVDKKPGRSSTKGNDRFFRAFARYVKEYGDAHAVFLDRGPDKEIAKQLVVNLGISDSITFLPEMRKAELIRHFQMADVVVDQFDIGAFGFTGLEVMACAKPVLIYLKNDCVDRCYPERPPVLNARTEDEIYEQIKLASDTAYRHEIGEKARLWIMKYHDGHQVAEQLMRIYQESIGK